MLLKTEKGKSPIVAQGQQHLAQISARAEPPFPEDSPEGIHFARSKPQKDLRDALPSPTIPKARDSGPGMPMSTFCIAARFGLPPGS